MKKMAWSLEKCDGNLSNKMGFVHPATEDSAEEAIEAIKAGKVIAVPTDTLYGFACDAWYCPYLGFRFCSLLFLKVYFFSVLFMGYCRLLNMDLF